MFALSILGAALWNGLRLSQAFFYWSILKEYHAEPGPGFAAITGGFWLVTGLIIFWGLWQLKSWARFGAIGVSLAYGSWYWLDRLILQKPHSNWPFSLGITILFLLISVYILYSPRVKKCYQRDTHDRKTEIKTSA